MQSPSPLLAQALQLFRRGAYPQAIGLLQQAVAAQPAHLEARLQLAKACLDWVQIQARAPLTEIEPDALGGDALHYLLLASGQLEALAKTHPASPHVQSLLAMLHLVYGRYEEALRCLKKALAKDPRNPDLLYNTGYALMEQERYGEAAMQFTRLTALHPQHGMGWQMLGETRRLSGDSAASVPAYRKAVALLPDLYHPYGALASALSDLDQYAEASEALQKGLARFPENWDLHYAMAKLALATEDWATGWRHYARRKSDVRHIPFEEGKALQLQAGLPLRVHYDQGLGDELFFLRFVTQLAGRGMTIHYTAHARLFPLLQGQPGVARLEASEPGRVEPYDVLVGDLPYLAGMRETKDIPPSLALRLDEGRVNVLRAELAAFGPPPYLGITWQGGKIKQAGHKGVWRNLFKEISPAMLGSVARDWPGTVVMLQRVPRAEDVASFSKALGRPFLDWSRVNDDLADALAGLSLLDEYVGVSNTNMHLLAGIGRTARVLVPYPADWRWLAKGEESPWFPGFRIYRQARNLDWEPALQALAESLKARWG